MTNLAKYHKHLTIVRLPILLLIRLYLQIWQDQCSTAWSATDRCSQIIQLRFLKSFSDVVMSFLILINNGS